MVRLLSIRGQVSLAIEQHSSLTQDRLASRKNFRSISDLTEAIGENVTVPGDPHQWKAGEAPRKKVETAAAFPNDSKVVYPSTGLDNTMELFQQVEITVV